MSDESYIEVIRDRATYIQRTTVAEMEVRRLNAEIARLNDRLCIAAANTAEDEVLRSNRADELQELREQVASRQAVIDSHNAAVQQRASERDHRLVSANASLIEDRDAANKRAQKAEAELATVKMQHEKDRTALAGYRELNGSMSRRISELEEKLASYMAEVATSEAEFKALKEGPCDASA